MPMSEADDLSSVCQISLAALASRLNATLHLCCRYIAFIRLVILENFDGCSP